MRARAVLFFLTLGVVVVVGVAPASAQQDSDEPAPTATTVPANAVSIGDGFWFTDATITPGDGSPTRTFDAYHAAVFVQSWLGAAFFGTPEISNPPATAPVSRIDVNGNWGGGSGYQTVYFA